MKKITTTNPANFNIINSYDVMDLEQVDGIINSIQKAQNKWAEVSLQKRCEVILTLADGLEQQKLALANLITQEMGKNIKESVAEAEKSIASIRILAKNAPDFLTPQSLNANTEINFEPLGIILGIMPWNFPLWQVIRFATPALLAGNGILLKHSSQVSGTSLLIDKILNLHLPKNLFRSIIFEANRMEEVIKNPAIKAVSLTGSVEAGRKVAEISGKYLKKSVLELGGSDPYLILKDADLAVAVSASVRARLINAGQSCVAGKRFIVEEKIYQPFIEKFVAEFKTKTYGNPLDSSKDLGSLSSKKARDEIHSLVKQAIKDGAKCLVGGYLPEESDVLAGAFYPATILEVDDTMEIFYKEIFGPVALVVRAKNEEKAIELANKTSFGLGSAIFSKNTSNAKLLAKKIQSGMCFINDFVKSDASYPFGGIKDSGYGRELGSFGFLEFVNIKVVKVG